MLKVIQKLKEVQKSF